MNRDIFLISGLFLMFGFSFGLGIGSYAQRKAESAKIDKAIATLTDGFEDNRLLYCSGPSQKTFEMAALAPHIRYSPANHYFEILNDKGEHFVYVPSQFESCRTVPAPNTDTREALNSH